MAIPVKVYTSLTNPISPLSVHTRFMYTYTVHPARYAPSRSP
jgi:hypothetical protein